MNFSSFYLLLVFLFVFGRAATQQYTEVACSDWSKRSHSTGVYVQNPWNKERARGRPYKQCIIGQGSYLGWSWDWQGCAEPSVFSYPEVISGAKPWDAMASTNPKLVKGKVGDYKNLVARVNTVTWGHHGTFNLALEAWTTSIPHPGTREISKQIKSEVMWVLHHNGGAKAPRPVVGRFFYDGVDWNVSKLYTEAGWHFIIFWPTAGSACSSVGGKLMCNKRIHAHVYLKWLTDKGWLQPSDYLEVFELGNEVYGGCNGTPDSKGHTIVRGFGVDASR